MAHCPRGREVIVGDEPISHYEAGGASALAGLVYHTIPTTPDGRLPIGAVAAVIRPSLTTRTSRRLV